MTAARHGFSALPRSGVIALLAAAAPADGRPASSGRDYAAPMAAAVAAGAIALIAGGWYARSRFRQRLR